MWEVFRFLLMILTGITLGISGIETAPQGLMLTILGSAIISTIGYFYLQYGEGKVLDGLIASFRHRNPDFFTDPESDVKQIYKLINKGENEKLEFKSTLRMNLHTKKPDRTIEYSILKTINAFLNTEGGTLLIGVADNGKIIGIENDGFPNNDKLYLHYTNLIKNHIGNEFLPFIKSKIIKIDKKCILKIECQPSDKEVFLKIDSNEDFYVRSGSASIKLLGTKLINYVNSKFRIS